VGAAWSLLPREDGAVWIGRAGRLSLYQPATGVLREWKIGGGADGQPVTVGAHVVEDLALAGDPRVWPGQ